MENYQKSLVMAEYKKETGSLPDPQRSYDGSLTASTGSISQRQEKATFDNQEKRYSIDVDMDEELKKYNIENKMNDYIAVQKAVVNHLKETGFFEKNGTVVNEETGMEIRINPSGIKETQVNGKLLQTLPKKLKLLKIATIEHLPEIIR